MKILANALYTVGKCMLIVYVMITGVYITWMAWQPVSWDMEPGGPEARMVLLLDNKSDIDLGGQIFCAYGIAFKDTGIMGLNLPMTDDDNRLRSCVYVRAAGMDFDKLGNVEL